jgi:hypothetical protein
VRWMVFRPAPLKKTIPCAAALRQSDWFLAVSANGTFHRTLFRMLVPALSSPPRMILVFVRNQGSDAVGYQQLACALGEHLGVS